MNIPDNVKILYKNYTVRMEKNLHEGHHDLYGQIDYPGQAITLDPDYPEAQKGATLLHEILHGLDDMYQIGLSEKKVGKLSVALYQLLEDNPRLFAEPKKERKKHGCYQGGY